MNIPSPVAPFVQNLRNKTPVWMQRSVGFRFLMVMVVLADIGVQMLYEATFARFPGIGTATALPYIGRSRGFIRGMNESDLGFAGRLVQWLDRWQIAGSQKAIAQAVRDYVSGNPMVRVVNRGGVMTTIDASGNVTVQNVTWNWDSLSNPSRVGYWSETWVIVYSPPWAETGPQLISAGSPPNTGPLGIGQKVPRQDVDAIKALLAQWKSAHSFIRCVIWSYDSSLFNPASSPTMPDGTWGEWWYPTTGTGARHRSGRSLSCRFWETERDPNQPTHA